MKIQSPEMWENVEIKYQRNNIWYSIVSSTSLGTILAVSDGSFDHDKMIGSFNNILSDSTEL